MLWSDLKIYLTDKTLHIGLGMMTSEGEGEVWDDSQISGLGHWVDGGVIKLKQGNLRRGGLWAEIMSSFLDNI